MNATAAFAKRNIKLFFKDKGMFFTSLITPAVLLTLYVSFLRDVYRNALLSSLPESFSLPDAVTNAFASGLLASSLLAVSCVTIAFCSNFLIVRDKADGTVMDFRVSPTRPFSLLMGYQTAAFVSTIIVCLTATGLCLAYVALSGWYMTLTDVCLLLVDVVLLTLFGVALSSAVNSLLSTQGQLSAVGTIVSAGYGFVCGAYMPLSLLGEGMRKAVLFLPGTYGTALIRSRTLRGVFEEMRRLGCPAECVDGIRDSFDCRLFFFGHLVGTPAICAVLGGSVVLLLAAYAATDVLRRRGARADSRRRRRGTSPS